MIIDGDGLVMVLEFKAEDYGDEAFPRAVKFGKSLAERLGVPFRKKRGLIVKHG